MNPLKTRKLCPVCRSPYIGIWLGAEAGIIYRCNECHYQGPIVIEEDRVAKPRASRERKVLKKPRR